jgi:acyl-CoA thioesterase
MPARFAADTSVSLVEPGRYAGRVDPGWFVLRGPNGGYVAAIILRALEASVADPDRPPRSLTVHYLRPPAEGPVEVEVTTDRQGRLVSALTARLLQNGKVMATALAAFGAATPIAEYSDVAMPAAPPPTALPVPSADGPEIPIRDRFDVRWAVGTPPPADGTGTGGNEVGGWIRFEDDQPVDYCAVAALTDAWMPAMFNRVGLTVAVPTIDLTVHLRDVPPQRPDWCFVRFRTRLSLGGYAEEQGEVWSSDGRLLAHSVQLAMVLPYAR